MPARESSRRADLAAIHATKKALGWDDDTYRDVMFTVCRVRSAADLDDGGRRQFLAHLRRCQQGATGGAPAPAKPRKALTPAQRKVWALWMQLADAGRVQARSMAAIDAWVAAQTGVSKLVWCKDAQMSQVIEQLKAWLERGGDR